MCRHLVPLVASLRYFDLGTGNRLPKLLGPLDSWPYRALRSVSGSSRIVKRNRRWLIRQRDTMRLWKKEPPNSALHPTATLAAHSAFLSLCLLTAAAAERNVG